MLSFLDEASDRCAAEKLTPCGAKQQVAQHAFGVARKCEGHPRAVVARSESEPQTRKLRPGLSDEQL